MFSSFEKSRRPCCGDRDAGGASTALGSFLEHPRPCGSRGCVGLHEGCTDPRGTDHNVCKKPARKTTGSGKMKLYSWCHRLTLASWEAPGKAARLTPTSPAPRSGTPKSGTLDSGPGREPPTWRRHPVSRPPAGQEVSSEFWGGLSRGCPLLVLTGGDLQEEREWKGAVQGPPFPEDSGSSGRCEWTRALVSSRGACGSEGPRQGVGAPGDAERDATVAITGSSRAEEERWPR
ncbi:hypothetical protein J1605_003634 [Eschrichtius robustus]|uniref:Uncharacterized protein n=1 Tax=Eschrichtius robustus TaxID=9764 RepID=A0AB34HRD9_ESCRO|nr:hypothetical protein J1605_003634 [Eschrichtius robustus]